MKKLMVTALLCLSLLSPTIVYAAEGDGETYAKKPGKPSTEQTQPPKGDITIEKEGDNIKITIENKKKMGTITIVKIDSDTKKPIEGVKFKLVDKTTKEIVAEGITGKDGVLIFDNIPIGDYYYEEMSAPKPY
ncbi:MAG: SpaA isopeptide-forming pilin-related protein [Clostridium sp.]